MEKPSQINLIVGDYFKVNGGFLIYGKKVTEVITWLRSKMFILALLHEAQLEHGLSNPLAVIHAVLTHWTAHYLAFC